MTTNDRKIGMFDSPIDKLLNIAAEKIGARNRNELMLATGLQPPTISKLRNGRINASADMILRLHDVTGLSVNEIRGRLGHKIFVVAHTNAQQAGAQQPAQN